MLLLKSLATLSGLLALGCAEVCEHFGDQCPEFSPCCNKGYCDATPRFCNVGCDAEASFESDSCNPTPYCVDMVTKFDKTSVVPIEDWNGDPEEADFVSDFVPNNVEVRDGKLVLYMTYDEKTEAGFGATVATTRFMEYGRATAVVRTGALAGGVVTSFTILSPTIGDELDFEWVGKASDKVQANYFYHVELRENIDYTKGANLPMEGDHTAEFHTYTLDWTPDYVKWIVDGKTLRTLVADEVDDFPRAPGRVSFSIWDASATKQEGTIEWAGGVPDWSDPERRFEMEIEELEIECYYKGNDTVEWKPSERTTKMKEENPDKVGEDSNAPSDDDLPDVGGTFDTPASGADGLLPSVAFTGASLLVAVFYWAAQRF